MRKVLALLVLLIALAGCAQPVQEPSEDHEKLMQIVEAVIKYQLIYGTPEEQENMEPITDEQVQKLAEYIEGVTNDVYGETAGR